MVNRHRFSGLDFGGKEEALASGTKQMVFSGGVWGAQTLFNPTQSRAAAGVTQSWSGGHSPSDSPPSLRTMSRSPRGPALASSDRRPPPLASPASLRSASASPVLTAGLSRSSLSLLASFALSAFVFSVLPIVVGHSLTRHRPPILSFSLQPFSFL